MIDRHRGWVWPIAFAIAAIGLLRPLAARAELAEVHFAHGFGIGYLQLFVMEHEKLVEKHAEALGLPGLKTRWSGLSDGTVQNEGLLSGSLHVAGAGIGAFLSFWSRGQGPTDVRAIAAMGSAPLYLNTRNPQLKRLEDFTDKDRIAITGPLVSPQATTLQYAAAKTWGDSAWARLDKLTVGMPNPTGMQALLAGTEVTAHFTTPPYTYQELGKPGIHRVLSSYDVWGGKHTTFLAWSTSAFREQNPKIFKAIYLAMGEAARLIAERKQDAARIYLAISGEKVAVEEVLKQLEDPEVDLSTTPRKTLVFAQFKHKIGAIKREPASWKDMFFPEAHGLDGD